MPNIPSAASSGAIAESAGLVRTDWHCGRPDLVGGPQVSDTQARQPSAGQDTSIVAARASAKASEAWPRTFCLSTLSIQTGQVQLPGAIAYEPGLVVPHISGSEPRR
ncbi:hypothetical protein SAMN04488074_101301 [Lentzea albidocapillata subsp. violacea]|uniref:Uncharacterized protein n=1 Tax=Lentzea albidocapillata subsp. violacea TaxID=128104 RepID=A0A1G8QCI9_9PSEU|nr:hypothetical protein SAMN04488074_101301 [Lentzea albidocapillata subsp. violacea]